MSAFRMQIILTWCSAFLLRFSPEAFQVPSSHLERTNQRRHISATEQKDYVENQSEDTRIFFDIAVCDQELGRIVFNLKDSERILPLHHENLVKLVTGAVRSIDNRCSYVNCSFKHSPQFVETFPQYRWAHTLQGRGKNAVREDRISDPQHLKNCQHSVYGGVYYGLEYGAAEDFENGEGVVLTVPLVGAYRGSTSFSIVRVGESPQEWRERLLIESAVLGVLESGIDVLREMARQTSGPPTVVASGMVE